MHKFNRSEMNKKHQHAGATVKRTRIDQARARVELAKTLKEQARTRAELAKTRREQTKTRAELAKTRVELVKTRKEKAGIQTKQVEKTLRRVVHKEFDLHDTHLKISPPLPMEFSSNVFADQKHSLERLTNRQREILRLIAESQNTKQIAGILKVSSKTVEYHRSKVMAVLNVHDVPGLVRFALRAGLIPPEKT
jgi:DNA-binding NarL/FixJ family response regulator